MNLIKRNKTFIFYVFSSGSSFILDLLFFTLFNYIFHSSLGLKAIIVSTILARILSSIYNYFINSRFVFARYSKKMFLKYYCLVFIQMIVSGILVYVINKYFIDIYATFIKFGVDIVLFILNYFIQKFLVFR